MDGAGRRVRTEDTWTAARDAYLSGSSAAEVCERFDLGLSALRTRARREGWRRVDQADPDPGLEDDLDEELEAGGPADFIAMKERTARLLQRALARGDAREAERWMRLYATLGPHVPWPKPAAPVPPTHDPAGASVPHPVHSMHPRSECTASASEASPTLLLNRAERRRQARLAGHRERPPGEAGAGRSR